MLPREIRLELRYPGDALFFVYECALTTRCGVVHQHNDPVASGLSAGRALSCLACTYRVVLCAFASSNYSALLLQPLGCARLALHQAVLLSCLDAACTDFLQSRPLGMLVSSAAALDALRSAEVTRRAVSPLPGDYAVPEWGVDSRAAAAGCALLDPADADTTEAAPGAAMHNRAARAGGQTL